MVHAGRLPEAQASYARGEEVLAGLAVIDPTNPSVARDWAAAESGQGTIAMESADYPAAIERFSSALARLDAIVRAHPERLEFRQANARVRQNLAAAQAVSGKWTAAIANFEHAAREFADNVARHPDVRQCAIDRSQFDRLLLTILCEALPTDLAAAERQAEAESARRLLRQELPVFEAESPLDEDDRRAIAECRGALGASAP